MNQRNPVPSRRAIFLDKDGTLVHDVPYNVDPRRVRLTPNAIEGLRLLQDEGYALYVLTNQAGIAKGLFSIEQWQGMQAYLSGLLASRGICIDGFYACPHHPQGKVQEFSVRCACRKPAPGMLLRAAGEHGIALEDSWMIGDILHDIEAGARAGCKTVLIDNGNETEWEMNRYRIPDLLASDLLEAAQVILAAGRNSHPARPSTSGLNNSVTE